VRAPDTRPEPASSGWHESILDEGRMPTRFELDQVSPDNPVFIPRGGHVITVNSKALDLAGITKDTPNPQGGVIVRDPATGEATGVLLETAAYLVRRILPSPPPPDDIARLLKNAMRELNSFGIVGVVEPGVDERQIAVYRKVHDAGEMTVRTDVLFRALKKADIGKASPRSARRRTPTCCASSASRFRSTAGSKAHECIRRSASCPASNRTRPIAAYRCCRRAARTSMSTA
jgi:predicted amidohydrolase YtcJ